MITYTIAVKEVATGTVVVDTIGEASSERALERTERGVNINLNHAEYYTQIVEKTDA